MRPLPALALAFMCLAAAPASELQTLRNGYALHYFDAAAHLRLARYVAEHDDRLTAFYICETARKSEFPQEEFERAYREVFHDDRFDNSTAAEERLLGDVAKAPEDTHARMRLADLYVSRSEWGKAQTQA